MPGMVVNLPTDFEVVGPNVSTFGGHPYLNTPDEYGSYLTFTGVPVPSGTLVQPQWRIRFENVLTYYPWRWGVQVRREDVYDEALGPPGVTRFRWSFNGAPGMQESQGIGGYFPNFEWFLGSSPVATVMQADIAYPFTSGPDDTASFWVYFVGDGLYPRMALSYFAIHSYFADVGDPEPEPEFYPQRIYPRTDGQGPLGVVRNYPPTKSYQVGTRTSGGYW